MPVCPDNVFMLWGNYILNGTHSFCIVLLEALIVAAASQFHLPDPRQKPCMTVIATGAPYLRLTLYEIYLYFPRAIFQPNPGMLIDIQQQGRLSRLRVGVGTRSYQWSISTHVS